jgi:hypothetical protein
MSANDHKRPAQAERVLFWLKSGQQLTQFEAIESLGILRLASRIDELRQEGHRIETNWTTVRNRFGERCRVASYSIKGEAS